MKDWNSGAPLNTIGREELKQTLDSNLWTQHIENLQNFTPIIMNNIMRVLQYVCIIIITFFINNNDADDNNNHYWNYNNMQCADVWCRHNGLRELVEF